MAAMNDAVDHAMFEQIFCALEPFWQFFADGFFDHPRSGKTDHGTWFSNGYIAQHRKGCGDTTGRGVCQNCNIGKLRFLDFVHGNDGPRHLHQGQDAFLHAGAAGRRKAD